MEIDSVRLIEIGKDICTYLLYDNYMGQKQGYTNQDDFQVLEFYCSFYTVKSSSVGCNR